ncbi:unnamed protein product [Rotaria magnacalcarata]|uniref:Uncharacterized protein n=1 Tax=Rotaria magnacalcarata TaxID=392030 RepID=A0A816V3Y9_9BILA|nr:unnamed protein product [Rotaria magnacalcarata]CAF2117970.1 unnamed protein product [Rotaria magnacalcarata]CAF3829671.1 unnamed protein product [Rotaria magnacalcarata]CAF3846230.1 unnamed protein product [Rotaria magnacalcarata]
MTQPKRVQVIRPNQHINEFIYERDGTAQDISYEQTLLNQHEYYAVGWRRLNIIQTLPLNENWPITVGNGAAAVSSGFLGGMITRRVARNLLLHLSSSTLPASGACLLACSATYVTSYYYFVLQPMFSNDPMLCPTCLEIRTFALGSFIPITFGTSIAILSNFSTCLINKTIRLPQFQVQAYPEWIRFFRKHVFKGMSRGHFFAYPLINGFLASMIFMGQHYYWKTNLQYRLATLEKELSYSEPKKRNKIFAPIEDFFIRLFGRKTK